MSIQFDPRAPAFRRNPYPYYDYLREHAPIFFWEVWGMNFLSRHEDCSELLRDNRLGRGAMLSDPPAAEAALVHMQSRWMLLLNPPDHTRLRGLVHKAFTPRMVEQLRGAIQRTTDQLLDQVQPHGEMELIADLAYPLPVTVIAEMLGVPHADRDRFHHWSDALARSLDLTDDPMVYQRASLAAAEFTDYLRDLSAQRRARPTNDLLSALVQVEEAGEHLSEDELYATCALLLVAGHETTINLIGNGALALLRHPEQLKLLQEQPALLHTAIEEMLRYDSPVQMTARTVLEEMEYKGQRWRRGHEVAFLLGAANHDPAVFAKPAKLDMPRDNNPHLSFGGGIHYCVGAPLARLEGQIAFATLLRRLPTLRLAEEQPLFRDNYVLRGLEALHLTF
ncbi:MAG TPA: cytochrome P450 [Caldilineaceae bacterium]|nr:cytochrome P450 [Caldilineaceae bacterium]